MTYKLTTLHGPPSETQEILQTHIQRISATHPYFTKVHVVTNTPPPKPTAQVIRSTITYLWDVVNDSTTTYVFAKPADEININPDLSFTNTLEFNKGKIRIVVHQDKFQMIPNLKNSSRVKKLSQDKVGHGGNYFVKYKYLIEMDKVVPELKGIIDTIFSEVEITTFQPTEVELQTNQVQLPSLQDLDNYELYECLSLVLNVSKDSIVRDDNFSRYEINWSQELVNKYTVADVSSEWINEIPQDWTIASLHGETYHILIHRTPSSTKIWEII
ncbi:uncharacterized protein SPAPADRAFT_63483 [Spathaspora passalidarum NRRL Y-27907]|uniref:Uncharacterized protein n=1 Tax=Spathaspora passalidarum (strain NRRL Y-27907 / 11-Y1) TaxID=619300 RepID=G3AV60_SPAPN|nr:uncharacterized protein SPAPADRAFT_63483 [Spathaspora passalidarum NRRL Y-27907]EGW29863.1 hypothetical protein SPAPADRAFT_63483 [Spathaspora passalidarum NRRL Y-27907]